MIINKVLVDFGDDRLAANEFMPNSVLGDVLIMHGAGESSQERSKALATELMNQGYRVVTFDFTSHGSSTGRLEGLSLNERQRQAEAIVDHFHLDNRLTVIGFSMSGQTAIDLLPILNPELLVLFAPAVYDKQARRAKFGRKSEFTRLISRTNSWHDSDAWDKMKAYEGSCLIIECELDDVIPANVPKTIYKNAERANTLLHIKILKAPHSIAKWMMEEPERSKWFAKAIINFKQDKSIDAQNSKKVSYKLVNNRNS